MQVHGGDSYTLCGVKPSHETVLGEVDQQRYPANSASSALASNRSAVSKPSVNQP